MTKKGLDTGLFSDFTELSPNILQSLNSKGFSVPTPIQHQVIPGGLQGKDIIGIAQTGTGKTLAFGIPMIQRIGTTKGQGLVLVPTRELALQVEKALNQIGKPLGLRTVVIMGGVKQHRQVQGLKANPHIVIATPGRLDDLMEQGLYNLKKVSVIALDEADRMLDIGFLKQITRILQLAPKNRQTLLFSATMPKSISSLASKFMKRPLRIEVAPQGTSAKNIEQEAFIINKPDKMHLLETLLKESNDKSILVFSRTKHGAKKIARILRKIGYTATEIHSNRTQAQRKAALTGFASGKFRVMVATDIAARGIDVKSISLVINYDLPENAEDYVHRIGRTGRAGRSGKAISFVTTSQKTDVKKIERLIRKTIPMLALPELAPKRERERNDSRGQRSRGAKHGQRRKRDDDRQPSQRNRSKKRSASRAQGRKRRNRRRR